VFFLAAQKVMRSVRATKPTNMERAIVMRGREEQGKDAG
jgi:hypothetical protein